MVGGTVTGPLANEFAQVREALDELPIAHVGFDEAAALAALARIEEHTHNMEKALEAIAAEDDLVLSNSSSFSIHAFRRCQQIARAALSAGEGTPE